ncbi:MAG: hypothetical protein LBL96_08395 [Clostridiales bacterium]|jgi:hypothetical protein|nr:hypothetical protein [Clostridiales bacterium]
MNDSSNSKSLALWLLMLSLAALATLSTVILVKSVSLADKAEVVTTVKSVEVVQSGDEARTAPIYPSNIAETEKPTEFPVEDLSEQSTFGVAVDVIPAETAEPTPTATPEPTATLEPYMDEPRFDVGYIEHHVVGQVFGVEPTEYAVVIFIKVDGVYYIKPSWQYGKTYLEDDGTFNTRAYTDDSNKWSDQSATAYSVFCVPADFDVYSMYNFSDISTVRGASILAAEDLPTGN